MTGTFNLIEGKNDPTTFFPLNTNIDGQIKPDQYLIEEQARHTYKKVESGNIININTLNKR